MGPTSYFNEVPFWGLKKSTNLESFWNSLAVSAVLLIIIIATAYHRRLADKISKKTKEENSSVMNHMRTRIRFSIMRSVLVALRGQRWQANNKTNKTTFQLATSSFVCVTQSWLYLAHSTSVVTRVEHLILNWKLCISNFPNLNIIKIKYINY